MRSRRHKILVVEDDPAMREILATVLRSWGYAVEAVSDGTEALERARRHPLPSAVLLDLVLPTMSGWEVAAEFKKSDALSRIPLVVTSVLVNANARFLPAADAYFGKPLNLAELQRVLNKLCSCDRRQ